MTKGGKMGKKLRIFFGGFWCGIMDICNKKLVHDALKKFREKYTF
jgi:hypothetical protein